MNILSQYKNTYNNFAYELSNAIDDYKYEGEGGKLRYAIDFSEIFAFILPAKSYQGFFLFNHLNTSPLEIASSQALHQLLLKNILFESVDKILLLPPYILELRAFIGDLQSKVLDNFANLAIKSFESAENTITEDAFFKEILEIIEKVDHNGSLSSIEETKIIDFIQRYGHILAMLEEFNQNYSALAQLRKFFEAGVFENLEDFVLKNLENPSFTQTDIFKRWYTYLAKVRGEDRSASAKLDATAIDLIGQVNQQFQKTGKNVRLLFFTRSYHMHSRFKEEFENKKWDEFGRFPFLRHPRVTSVLSILDKAGTTDPVKLATDELEAIKIFLNSLTKDPKNDVFIQEDLKQQIDQIENNWKKAQALILSSNEAVINIGEHADNINQARRILNLLKIENVHNLAVDTLDSLIKEIEFTYSLMAFNLQLPMANQPKVRSTAQSIPCFLHFTSNEAKKLVELFGPGKEFEIRNVIEAFKAGFSNETNYELVLAMAYILGALNKWEKAKEFCEQALNLGEKNNQERSEGLFFLSVCLRKLVMNSETFSLAQNFINQALKISPNDPRFLKEKGSQIILVNLLYRDNKNFEIPSPEAGLYFLYQAEQNLESNYDKELLVQILNNRLFYNISVPKPQNIERLKEEFKKLERLQFEIEPNEEFWSSGCQDTLAWAEWILYYDDIQHDINRQNKIIRRLELAKDSSEINDQERRARIGHLKAVLSNRK